MSKERDDALEAAVLTSARAWWLAVERWKAAEQDDSPRPIRPIIKAADRAENRFWDALAKMMQREAKP